jgi:probable rRNA maturation factor
MIESSLHIEIAATEWKDIAGLRQRLEKAAALVLKNVPANLRPIARRAEATLLLTSNAEIRHLNRDFRGIDKPTNVLSFPHFTPRQLTQTPCPVSRIPCPMIYLGDIAIAYGVAVREARQQNKKTLDHLTHLTIHGLLHLFGYDHTIKTSAARMERLEKKLMADLDLPDPYES